MELGLYTFAERTPDPVTGETISPAQRLHEVVEEVELADQVGLDVFGLGEHHRPDYVSSAPDVILAAAAERTRNIRLTSAVTVLSSDEPVRVFQQYATLRVHWAGRHRPALEGVGVYPRPLQDPLPVWVAVGGNPPSVVRAARLGLPMALAIIGGEPERFAPLVQLYRQTAEKAGHDPASLPVSINSHGFIAEDSQQAADEAWPSTSLQMNRIGQERGWPPMTHHAARQGHARHRTLRDEGRTARPRRTPPPRLAPEAATVLARTTPDDAAGRRAPIIGTFHLRQPRRKKEGTFR